MSAALTSADALQACAVIATIAVALSSVESISRPGLMADEALGSWEVSRLATSWRNSRPFRFTVGWALAYPLVLGLIAARLACALTVVFAPSPVRAAAAAVVVVISILLSLRTQYGHDGSDEMVTIVFIVVGIASWLHQPLAREISLWFLAAEAGLAYLAAGAAKAVSRSWRSGAALPGILSTRSYGNRSMSTLLGRHQVLASAACWSVIAGECGFPLALLGIAPVTVILLAWGALFHLGAAVIMRLNTFLWAFLATYPAVLFCAHVPL